MVCSICLENISSDESIQLQCEHTFHIKCMFTYISKNFDNDILINVCPICRKHISCNLQHILNIHNINYCPPKNYKRHLCLIICHVISICTSVLFFHHVFK